MKRFTIFGRPGCGFCVQAQRLLESKEYPYKYVDIQKEGIGAEELSATVGRPVRTVPQIFYGEDYVGGYTELVAYLKEFTTAE
ncbi:Glutaredoxin 1 [invertebrate metagenome]|uniref:Glutaredoxin 1 n=1 Tax=invertebrate metagenome TaxID=1711999 RepID=A0A2H9T6A9_9ZZZZ